MEEKRCKHEFRQKLTSSTNTGVALKMLDHDGYYCIYCLLEVRSKSNLDGINEDEN